MSDDERADTGITPQADRVGDAHDRDDLPTIPDGGLSETLPEWLRRPPAWRGMVVPEAVEVSGASQASTEVVPAPDADVVDAGETVAEDESPVPVVPLPRVIPEPDRSPIDPASLIELSDLPAWLIGLGKREVPPKDDPDAMPSILDGSIAGDPPAPFTEEIVLRSQASVSEESTPASVSPAGKGMRALVLLGVIAVVVLIAILIAQFG